MIPRTKKLLSQETNDNMLFQNNRKLKTMTLDSGNKGSKTRNR